MTTQEQQSLSTLDRLEAIEDIRRLKARYTRLVDTHQWDQLGELLTDDVHFTEHLVPFGLDGRDALIEALSAGMAETVSVHHALSAEIDILSSTTARGIWALEDYLVLPPGASYPGHAAPSTNVHGYGHYVDEYAKVGGSWRISSTEIYRLRHEVTSHSSTPLPDALRG